MGKVFPLLAAVGYSDHGPCEIRYVNFSQSSIVMSWKDFVRGLKNIGSGVPTPILRKVRVLSICNYLSGRKDSIQGISPSFALAHVIVD